MIILTNLICSLVGAFSGAYFAFLFNNRSVKKKEEENKLSYLTFTVSAIANLTNNLYSIKISFVLPRLKIIKKIQKTPPNPMEPINLDDIYNFMLADTLKMPFVIEKLSFLACKDANIITIFNQLESSINQLNIAIKSINNLFSEESKNQTASNNIPLNTGLMTDLITSFSKQTDSTLYFAEKISEVLINYCRATYNKKFIINKLETLDKYKNLKPGANEFWEEIDWFPKHLQT